MRRDAWACEYPDHEGDRLVAHPYDRWTKKTTYMRSDQQVRRHERPTEPAPRRCTACADLEAERETPTRRLESERLF